MKALLAIVFLSSATPVLAANTCSIAQGQFVFEKVVKLGTTTTYFNPALTLGPDESAAVVDMQTQSASDGVCRAFGHQSGRVGSSIPSPTSGKGVEFKQDGTLYLIESFTQYSPESTLVITSITCE